MKKATLLIGMAAILTFGVFVYAARNSRAPATPELMVEGDVMVEPARNEAWAQDPRSRAATTEGLEKFLPQGKEEVVQTESPGFGDLVAQYTWSSLGIGDPQYAGAGLAYVEGSDGNPYLLLAHCGVCGIYILDISGDPPVLTDSVPRAELEGPYQAPWGLAVDNDKELWYADLSWNVYDWCFEYAPEPPGHPTYTGNNFNHRQGYACMADGTENAPGDTIWWVHVGGDNHVFGYQEPGGSAVRNFGHSTWDYVSMRGLAYNTDDGTMHIGSWNVDSCWEISAIDGTPIPGRSFATNYCAGLAYQPEPNRGPYLWVQENSDSNYLKKYHCPPLGVEESREARTEPQEARLYQNRPNPFSRRTHISYHAPANSPVSLRIYDSLGRLVKTLVDQRKKPGCYLVVWDGRDEHGTAVSPGVYFYRLETESFRKTKKLTVLR